MIAASRATNTPAKTGFPLIAFQTRVGSLAFHRPMTIKVTAAIAPIKKGSLPGPSPHLEKEPMRIGAITFIVRLTEATIAIVAKICRLVGGQPLRWVGE